eukprot:524850_1
MARWLKLNHLLEIMSVVAVVITGSITIVTYYNHYKYPKEFKLKTHKLIATTSVTCYTVSMLAMSICYNFENSNDKTSLHYIVGFLIYVFLWGVGICSSYLLFILRLRTTFKSSVFDSSIYLYSSLFLSLIIWFLCHIALILIELSEYYHLISSDTKAGIHFIELCIKCVLLLYLSIVITYLFVSKLIQMRIRAFDGNELKVPLTGDQSHNIHFKLSEHDVQFLNIATKMTVLSTIMVTTSVVVICIALASILLRMTDVGGVLWYFTAMMGLMVDSTTNVLCIYLSFPYASSRQMYKILCQPSFHRCCYFISEKKFKKKILEKVTSTEMEEF